MKFIKHFLKLSLIAINSIVILYLPALIIKWVTDNDAYVLVYVFVLLIAVIAYEAYKRTNEDK